MGHERGPGIGKTLMALRNQWKQGNFSASKDELLKSMNESLDNDLNDVADWMNTTPDRLNIDIVQEPIEKFIKQIREMYDSYDEFPEDAKRTNNIVKLLYAGKKAMPIYVDKGDPHLFVMEGRHRMVAFMLAGMKRIPVAYVSVNPVTEEGPFGVLARKAGHLINKSQYIKAAEFLHKILKRKYDETGGNLRHTLGYYASMIACLLYTSPSPRDRG